MLTIQTTIQNWRLEFEKHYDPAAGLNIEFIICHRYGNSKHSIETHLPALRERLKEPLPKEDRRLSEDEYIFNRIPKTNQHRYLVLSTQNHPWLIASTK